MIAELPTLIPQPRHFERSSDSFALNAATVIALVGQATEATIFAARNLQTAIEAACGLKLQLSNASASANRRNTIRLILQGDGGSEPPSRTSDTDLHPQAYHLAISEQDAVITAADSAGLFYGVQTLIQLVRTHGRRLPGCRCSDEPALPHRGVMLDISRGKVPTLATLEHLADTLAHYKINQVQLYTEHTFQFPSHPKIGANCGNLSGDDMLALDQFCRARHIDLVPNLQSTGHMRHILSLPEYEHLAETPWRWSITPAREEAYRFLDDLYADFLPAFSVPILNVDSDEAWDHGRGQAKELSASLGFGRVYLNHILRLRDLAARHGRRIMIWADVLHHYPELIAEIPEDITLLDWAYEALPTYPTLAALAQAKRPFYVCPGTSTWNTIFPRIDNALGNIRNYVRAGLEAGAIGMLNTDWGDMGHYQPLSHSWYGYLFGAEMAWSGALTPTERFDAAFGSLFLGDPSGRAVAAIRRLGRAVEQPALAASNRSDTVYALYDEPLAGKMINSTPPEALIEMAAAGEEAMMAFSGLPDRQLRRELMFSTHQMIYAATKVQLGQAIHHALRDLARSVGPTDDGVARLDALLVAMNNLRAELPPMVTEFEDIWLQSAQRSEIQMNLDRYHALMARFDAALEWLRTQRVRYAADGTLDAELATYTPGEYLLLWDQSLHDLRRLLDLVGRDAMPPDVLRWLDRAG